MSEGDDEMDWGGHHTLTTRPGSSSSSQSHGHTGRPSSSQRIIVTPEILPISLDRSVDSVDNHGEGGRGSGSAGGSLCRPQTFALQMINELTELQERGRGGAELSAEEESRLASINRAITAILEQEDSEVQAISARLDSITEHSDSNSHTGHGGGGGGDDDDDDAAPTKWRDPLTPFCYNLSLRPPFPHPHPPGQEQQGQGQENTRHVHRGGEGGEDEEEGRVDNTTYNTNDTNNTNNSHDRDDDDREEEGAVDLVSYKTFAAYHHDRNRGVLSGLASYEF